MFRVADSLQSLCHLQGRGHHVDIGPWRVVDLGIGKNQPHVCCKLLRILVAAGLDPLLYGAKVHRVGDGLKEGGGEGPGASGIRLRRCRDKGERDEEK